MLASYEEARQALGGISGSTLRRLIRAGDLPAVRIGRRVMVHRDALEAFVRSRQAPVGDPATRQG
jgi:excisionase family DNA binding protein